MASILERGQLSGEGLSGSGRLSVPWWAVRALYFCTSYHPVAKRFLPLAWGMSAAGDGLGQVAKMGALVNATLCVGTLLFSWVFDLLLDYYSAVLLVMGASAGLAAMAWAASGTMPLDSPPLRALVLGVLFTSSAAGPIRDAITARLVWHAQEHPSTSQAEGGKVSFGENRMCVVLGHMVIALVVSNVMELFGPNSCLGVLTACLTATFLLYGTSMRSVATWYASEASGSYASLATPSAQKVQVFDVVMLCGGFLCVGIASGLVEVILFAQLHKQGMPLPWLGVAHMLAAGTELPVFYREHSFVKLCGSYEGTFILGAVTMSFRLIILAAAVIGRPMTPVAILLFFFTESLHGFCRAPLAFTTAKLAAAVAPPHLTATFQGVLNVACGFGGTVVGCSVFWLGLCHDIRFNFFAAAFIALLSALQMAVFRLRQRRDSKGGVPVKIRRLVIVVRADPVICGHSTEARNLAEAARQNGTEVHIVTWPLEVLQRAGLPLKDTVEPYSPGIYVHRPEGLGDEKVLDGQLLGAMAAKIEEILTSAPQEAGDLAARKEEEEEEEVDVIMTFYLVPHVQPALTAALALRTSAASNPNACNRKVVTIGKAVGSDITAQVTACLNTGNMGGAVVIFSQFLQNDILQAVSVYTKDVILECARAVDAQRMTKLTEQLSQRIEISYPPIDSSMYRPFASMDAAAVSTAKEVCSKYSVQYGRFLLYVSRIMPAKGVDDLIRAYQQSKVRAAGVPLLVCGSGPDLQKVRQLASSDALIQVVGSIPDEDKAPLLHACLAFCLPSKPTPTFVETFGIAISEKMLAGGPGVVVSTRTGGIPEATGGSEFSVVVDHSSQESIKEGLERAIFMPDRDRSEMASAASAYAQRFDRAEIWSDTYKSVCACVERQRPFSGSPAGGRRWRDFWISRAVPKVAKLACHV